MSTFASKAERLAIASAVAAPVRQKAARRRPVTLIGKDGQPKGTSDTTEVTKGILTRAGIEFSVQPGKRPEYIRCESCGDLVRVRPRGAVPRVCAKSDCRNRPSATLADVERDARMSTDARAVERARIEALAAERGMGPEWVETIFRLRFPC